MCPEYSSSGEIDESERDLPQRVGPDEAQNVSQLADNYRSEPRAALCRDVDHGFTSLAGQPRIALDADREPIGSNRLDQRGAGPTAEINDQPMWLGIPSDSRHCDRWLGFVEPVGTPEIGHGRLASS